MSPHELTAEQQAFLEGYRVLCEAHGMEFDVSGHDCDVELAVLHLPTRPGLLLWFDAQSPSRAVPWSSVAAEGNAHLSARLRAMATEETYFMHFVDPDTNTVKAVAIKKMPPFVVPED